MLTPVPSRLKSLEGYASLHVSGEEGILRSKFSFLFNLPDQGRIGVTDVLGRSLYQIFFVNGEAYFLPSSKKVYWQGSEQEIVEKFLGFRLSLEEMIRLMSGQWDTAWIFDKEQEGRPEWVLRRDKKERIRSGKKGELFFEVEEYIGNSGFVRSLVFSHRGTQGRMKILRIGFNRPLKKGVFSTAFLQNYEPRTWDEIQKMIHAN